MYVTVRLKIDWAAREVTDRGHCLQDRGAMRSGKSRFRSRLAVCILLKIIISNPFHP